MRVHTHQLSDREYRVLCWVAKYARQRYADPKQMPWGDSVRDLTRTYRLWSALAREGLLHEFHQSELGTRGEARLHWREYTMAPLGLVMLAQERNARGE